MLAAIAFGGMPTRSLWHNSSFRCSIWVVQQSRRRRWWAGPAWSVQASAGLPPCRGGVVGASPVLGNVGNGRMDHSDYDKEIVGDHMQVFANGAYSPQYAEILLERT